MRPRIAVSIIVIALIISASVISGLWMSGFMSPKQEKKGPTHPTWQNSLKVLDIWGLRESISEPNITRIQFKVSTWHDGGLPLDVRAMKIHWTSPVKSVYLTLNASAPTISTATHFSAAMAFSPDESPKGWDPFNGKFRLYPDYIVSIILSLEPNDINDSLAPGSNADVVFIVQTGYPSEETFTTPSNYGNALSIDLTML